MIRHLTTAFIFAFLVRGGAGASAQPAGGTNWTDWSFLQGTWTGEGSSEAGQGAGYFSFEPDLLGKVWVRRNHAEYPGPKGQPPFVHEDLMIVYDDPASHQTRAFYSDTEGHTIQYSATFSSDRKTLTFLGDVQPAQPRYRLTYVSLAPGRMSVILEIAQPDHLDQFKKIVEGTVTRK